MKAMILAAGLSTRLQPFSLKRPKPLFPVLGHPLLLLTIERLKRAGFDAIIVNTHYLHDQISLALRHENGIVLQEENEILGTGGGLRRAVPHFNSEPVLVVNSDIYHTVDYAQVYRRHCSSKGRVSLVLHDYPRFNTVTVNEKSQVVGLHSKEEDKNPRLRRMAFTGIHVIDPEILLQIAPGRFFNIIDCYQNLLRQGITIKAQDVTNTFWTDIGSLRDYLDLHKGLLEGRIPPYEELGFCPEVKPFYVSEDAALGDHVSIKDWVYVGANANIGRNVSLQRVVVWDGASVNPGAELIDTIAV